MVTISLVHCFVGHLALTGGPDALLVIEGGVIRDYTVKGWRSDASESDEYTSDNHTLITAQMARWSLSRHQLQRYGNLQKRKNSYLLYTLANKEIRSIYLLAFLSFHIYALSFFRI